MSGAKIERHPPGVLECHANHRTNLLLAFHWSGLPSLSRCVFFPLITLQQGLKIHLPQDYGACLIGLKVISSQAAVSHQIQRPGSAMWKAATSHVASK